MRLAIADAGSTLEGLSWPLVGLLLLLMATALFIGVVAGVWLEERENTRQIRVRDDFEDRS